MASEWLEKMRSIGSISKRTHSEIREGRSHPDSGLPWKATKDELGNVVTEHGSAGSGVSQRQDVNLHPETIRWPKGSKQ